MNNNETEDNKNYWSWSFIENWNRSRLWTILAGMAAGGMLTWLIVAFAGEKRYRLVISSALVLMAIMMASTFAYVPFYLMGFEFGWIYFAVFGLTMLISFIGIEAYARSKKQNPGKKLFGLI